MQIFKCIKFVHRKTFLIVEIYSQLWIIEINSLLNSSLRLSTLQQNMAENLKPKDDENEHKEKLEQMDSKLKYIKDMIIEEALRYANLEDEADLEKV